MASIREYRFSPFHAMFLKTLGFFEGFSGASWCLIWTSIYNFCAIQNKGSVISCFIFKLLINILLISKLCLRICVLLLYFLIFKVDQINILYTAVEVWVHHFKIYTTCQPKFEVFTTNIEVKAEKSKMYLNNNYLLETT